MHTGSFDNFIVKIEEVYQVSYGTPPLFFYYNLRLLNYKPLFLL